MCECVYEAKRGAGWENHCRVVFECSETAGNARNNGKEENTAASLGSESERDTCLPPFRPYISIEVPGMLREGLASQKRIIVQM